MKKTNTTSLVIVGIAPLLGAASRLHYALWASIAFAAVLILSSAAAWGIGRLIKGRIRLLVYTAISAGLTTSAVMILRAYVPTAEAGIGVCLSYAAANSLILYLCEANAEPAFKTTAKNAVICALGGSVILMVTAAVRELLQHGSVSFGFADGEGVRIFSDWFSNVEFAGTTAGTLIIFGLIAALAQKVSGMVHNGLRNRMLRRERIASGRHPDLVCDGVTGKIVRRSTAKLLEQKRYPREADAEDAGSQNDANAENGNSEKTDAENGGGEGNA